MYALSSGTFLKNPYNYFLPGITDETVETCSRLLQQDYENHHVFFRREAGFHNHTSHHLLAALGLGASSATLERIYKRQKANQQPARPLHDAKDFELKKCLGDDNYHHDYLQFFAKELENEQVSGENWGFNWRLYV